MCCRICLTTNVNFPTSLLQRPFYSRGTVRLYRANKSGWINEELFIDFLHHVSHLTACSPERKILTIMDNHKSHITLAAIDKAREPGIVLLTIPPKTSHKLQLLDKTVFGSFKNSYNKAIDNWMRSNPGKTISIYDIPCLVNEPQLASMVLRNIISGFSSIGIWPYNSEIFSEADFVPSIVSDRDPYSASLMNTAEPLSEANDRNA